MGKWPRRDRVSFSAGHISRKVTEVQLIIE